MDMLQALLPQKVSAPRSVVVIDRHGQESPKFDGVLIDRFNLPLLYDEGGIGAAATSSAMIESIAACIETKSSLRLADLNDMFDKTEKVRRLTISRRVSGCPVRW